MITVKFLGFLAAVPAAGAAFYSFVYLWFWLGCLFVVFAWFCYAVAVAFVGIRCGLLYQDGSPIVQESERVAAAMLQNNNIEKD